jgi:hypothetical protein
MMAIPFAGGLNQAGINRGNVVSAVQQMWQAVYISLVPKENVLHPDGKCGES